MSGNTSPNRKAVLVAWRERNKDRLRDYQRVRAHHPNQAECRARAKLRTHARKQAEETGEDVLSIYARWGCLSLSEQRELTPVREAAE